VSERASELLTKVDEALHRAFRHLPMQEINRERAHYLLDYWVHLLLRIIAEEPEL